MNDVKIVAAPGNKQELSEVKSVMEIFVVNYRIRQLAQLA